MATGDALRQDFLGIVSQAGIAAADHGYARKQSVLRRVVEDNVALISFQKSSRNTVDGLSFTINLSIVCGALLDPGGVTISAAKEYDGHLRQRIGPLMRGGADKWWEISSATRIDVLSAEITNLVVSVAVPYLERYVRTGDLTALWEAGQSPGLTEIQRVRFLAQLNGLGRVAITL